MPFTQSPAGATSNFTLLGTDGIDITTLTGATPNVTVDALAGNDQVTVQNTNGVVNGLRAILGAGDDRIFADSAPNDNQGSVVLNASTVSGGLGDDILFGTQAGVASNLRTAYFVNTLVNGNQGRDLIRAFGVLTSRLEGGQDEDTIELANLTATDGGIFPSIPDIITSNQTALFPDRYDGGTIQGSRGNDTIRIALSDTNVVNTRINGNEDNDLISNFGVALNGNWANSTIFGGSGNDTVAMQTVAGGNFVTSSLYVLGNLGNDALATGTGNDTLIGGDGNDSINTNGGDNLIYGDNSSFDGTTVPGTGADLITISSQSASLAGSSTVFAGAGNDSVTITTNGNNIVQGADGDDSVVIGGAAAAAGGNGSNSVTGNAGNDIIAITGSGINTAFGGTGNDIISFTGKELVSRITAAGFGETGNDTITLVLGINATLEGGDGNDTINIQATGNVQVGGGTGNDTITFNTSNPLSASINGGTGADIITDNALRSRFVQRNGDSLSATAVTDTDTSTRWSAGDTIVFGSGVDQITNFTQATDLLETTLGDLGLDFSTSPAGRVYAAFDTAVSSGMVAGRTYFLNGTWNAGTRTFTVLDNNDVFATSTLLVTAGNNGPITTNANAVVLTNYVNNNVGLNTVLTRDNFDTFLG